MARESVLERDLALQIRAYKLPLPKREHCFAPPRRWKFDFCWEKHRLAVEVEGVRGRRSRHVTAEGYEGDCIKYFEAFMRDWAVVRVTGDMVRDGRAILVVQRALKKVGAI